MTGRNHKAYYDQHIAFLTESTLSVRYAGSYNINSAFRFRISKTITYMSVQGVAEKKLTP